MVVSSFFLYFNPLVPDTINITDTVTTSKAYHPLPQIHQVLQFIR